MKSPNRKNETEKAVLLIATLDTKEEEAFYLKKCIESEGIRVLVMDVGMLHPPHRKPEISQTEVAQRGGMPLKEAVATGDKYRCTVNMIRGAEAITRELYGQGRIQGVVSIGGGQGTEIGCTVMRALPTGVPRLMVSTIASGQHTFGTYVGTKDITMMHSVADIQGLNFLMRRILENAAGAISGMVRRAGGTLMKPDGVPVAMSMLGTTTPGALRAKKTLQERGFEVVAFHQNGTGGIAMEDMIREGAFKGVLDLNLHEIGDRWFGGLHGAIREDRLEAAGEMGLPQVIAPGSIEYSVQGPVDSLSAEMKKRKFFVHNPRFTLVRLLPDELREVGKLVAQKLNKAKGPVKVFIPLKGFSFPDREGLPNWDPEGDQALVSALKENVKGAIPIIELDAHINDPEFIDPVVNEFVSMMKMGLS
ncbi:MAG: Tm-1-like ATP-binding domain-containing protein [Syntrophaceae bacterium]|nr:Tm-1-like ATP-binding domain-containing protein [Syntrophaceae bacterium]